MDYYDDDEEITLDDLQKVNGSQGGDDDIFFDSVTNSLLRNFVGASKRPSRKYASVVANTEKIDPDEIDKYDPKDRTPKDRQAKAKDVIMLSVFFAVVALLFLAASASITAVLVNAGNDINGRTWRPITYSIGVQTFNARNPTRMSIDNGWIFVVIFGIAFFYVAYAAYDSRTEEMIAKKNSDAGKKKKSSNGALLTFTSQLNRRIHTMYIWVLAICLALLSLPVCYYMGNQDISQMNAIFGIVFLGVGTLSMSEVIYEQAGTRPNSYDFDATYSWWDMVWNIVCTVLGISTLWAIADPTYQPGTFAFYWILNAFFAFGVVYPHLVYFLRPFVNRFKWNMSPIYDEMTNQFWLLVVPAIAFGMVAVLSQFKQTTQVEAVYGTDLPAPISA